MRYLVLLRGINVGGKNKIPMTELKAQLETAGFSDVSTYINSGNAFLESGLSADRVEKAIETLLPQVFKLDSQLIRVRVLSAQDLEAAVKNAPGGFGTRPDVYHYDVLVPMNNVTAADIMAATETNPEVDQVWEANGVVYYQRLSAKLTRSRLNKLIGNPVYKSVTIRNWNTTLKLLSLF